MERTAIRLHPISLGWLQQRRHVPRWGEYDVELSRLASYLSRQTVPATTASGAHRRTGNAGFRAAAAVATPLTPVSSAVPGAIVIMFLFVVGLPSDLRIPPSSCRTSRCATDAETPVRQ